MNKSVASVLMIAALALTSACGQKSEQKSEAKTPVVGLADGLRMIEKAQLIEDSNSSGLVASESVGWLLTATDKYVYECTTFVVGPRTLYTNSHCIPDELHQSLKSANGQMFAIFPEKNGKLELRIPIKEIFFVSEINQNNTQKDFLLRSDYAVLTTETDIDRTPVTLSTSGINDSEFYQIHSMNPEFINNQLTGHLVVRTCEAVHMSAYLPYSNDSQAAVTILKDCYIEHGNSGSPVFNQHGVVQAIAHGMITRKEDQPLDRDYMADRGLIHANHDLTMVTNFSCVTDFTKSSIATLPAVCSKDQWGKEVLLSGKQSL